jgi:hypothetical protein
MLLRCLGWLSLARSACTADTVTDLLIRILLIRFTLDVTSKPMTDLSRQL